MIPGEMIIPELFIELNAGRPTMDLAVLNSGDRPVQVGSHYHFYFTSCVGPWCSGAIVVEKTYSSGS